MVLREAQRSADLKPHILVKKGDGSGLDAVEKVALTYQGFLGIKDILLGFAKESTINELIEQMQDLNTLDMSVQTLEKHLFEASAADVRSIIRELGEAPTLETKRYKKELRSTYRKKRVAPRFYVNS